MKNLKVLAETCSRRTMLRGLGAAAAIAMVPGAAGCMSGSNLPTATTTSCSPNEICIDVSASANATLGNPGGAMLVDGLGDTIVVIRTSATEVVAVSAICTHAGCTVTFDSSQKLLVCPCHGSEFTETGSVVRGPAGRPLKAYTAVLDSSTITISG